MRTRVPPRGRLSSSPSISSRSSASDTGRKLMLSSAASLRREITCPSVISPRRILWRTTVYASEARLDCSASFMGRPAFRYACPPQFRATPAAVRFYERNASAVRIDWTKEREPRFGARTTTTSLHLLLLAVLMITGAIACASAPSAGPLDRLHPCSSSEGPIDAYCGTLSVFENRDTKQGRQIALAIT